MKKVKQVYKINKEKYYQTLEMSEKRFITRFKTLNSRAPRWTCCDDVYNIMKKETKNYIIFDCELEGSDINEIYYFKKYDLKSVGVAI